MPIASLAEWLAYLQLNPDAHLLQTGEWGELKSAFGWQPVRIVSGDLGVQILFRKLPLGLTIAYIPKPLARVLASIKFLSEIDEQCRRLHAVFLKVEPDILEQADHDGFSVQTDLRFLPEGSGLNRSPHAIQPPRTITISLSGGEDEILVRMKQKCRYNIRLAEKKGIVVRPWDDLEAFHGMMTITGGRDGFAVHALDYYRRAYELFHPAGMTELLVAEFEGRPLAGLMVFARGKRAWYLYGASTDEERNRMPAYLLQWQAMRWARDHGCQEYDLWGVPDLDERQLEAQFESRSDGLWGVYRFKRGFGGRVVRSVPSLDRVYMPWLYRAYLWRNRGSLD
jgi:peptidoglycan pentaglycine glycine transferase (the first glycine)